MLATIQIKKFRLFAFHLKAYTKLTLPAIFERVLRTQIEGS